MGQAHQPRHPERCADQKGAPFYQAGDLSAFNIGRVGDNHIGAQIDAMQPIAMPQSDASAQTEKMRIAPRHVQSGRLLSIPNPRARGRSANKVNNRQPDPVPKSISCASCSGGKSGSAASIKVSLSGRGSSTAWLTRKRRPQNSL